MELVLIFVSYVQEDFPMDENYNPMPSSSASSWPEDEPLVEDVNMNAFRDELAHALFHGVS
jgi:hypothetical protein